MVHYSLMELFSKNSKGETPMCHLILCVLSLLLFCSIMSPGTCCFWAVITLLTQPFMSGSLMPKLLYNYHVDCVGMRQIFLAWLYPMHFYSTVLGNFLSLELLYSQLAKTQQREIPNLWPTVLNSDGQQWLDPAEVPWALRGGFEFGTGTLVQSLTWTWGHFLF